MTTTKKSSQAWKIQFLETAEKQFDKLDKGTSKLIERFIIDPLTTSEDPRRFGKVLSGNLKEFWRYRIGDYRLICSFKDKELLILVLRVAHRREVYD